MTANLDQLRSELSAAASRETAAVRAFLAAKTEVEQAQRAYRDTRKRFDAACKAAEFERANPPLFGGTEDCSGAWDGFQVVSDADPGL